MAEYTLKYINHRAECDAEAFVNDCEEQYHRQLHLVADQIAANCKHKPVVLLNGPSSSGKTTTNDRLGRILELAGIHTHMISMDDYYRTAADYEQPMDDEHGAPTTFRLTRKTASMTSKVRSAWIWICSATT